MRRKGTTALLLGATLGGVGIALHVTAGAARPTAERLLAGAMSLTPAGSDCGGRLTRFYARLALRSPGSTDDRVFVLGPPCSGSH